MGGNNNRASDEARQAEEQRQRQVQATQQRIEQIYGAPSRENDIQDVRNATRDYLQGDLDRQTDRAGRQLKFALARDGQTQGSNDVYRNKDLAESYLRGGLEIGRRADAAGNSLRQADQSSKLNLFNMATTGLDMTTAARQAGESMRNNIGIARADALQSGLGDLFANLGDVYKTSRERKGQRDANKYRDQTAYSPMAGFSSIGQMGF